MRAFTLFEIVIILVILGIIGAISGDIIQKAYLNYMITQEENKLNNKVDLTLFKLASILENRVKNSTIAVECNATKPSSDSESCLYNKDKKFIYVGNIDENSKDKYPVLEWLSVDIYAKRGMWNGSYVMPGFSGFVDLKRTKILGNDTYTIISPESNFSIVKVIDENYTKMYGIDADVFEDNLTTLIFSGSDGRGELGEINDSYGYYHTDAKKVFSITKNSDNNITIKAITSSNETTVYEGYFIVNGAKALVPIYNKSTNDYNLTLFYNYYPYKGENYLDGNFSLIASGVSAFSFKEENGVLKILLCINSHKIKVNDENLTICREKVIY